MDLIHIIDKDDPILVTGANGFIGSRVVENLISRGFYNIRCFVRPSSNLKSLSALIERGQIDIKEGNLISIDDCRKAADGVSIIYHLAAGSEKSFSGAFLNSVVTTRNLLDVAIDNRDFRRFLNVSSFSVYANRNIQRHGHLDENAPLEDHCVERNEAYCYGKLKQEEIVKMYHRMHKLPYVIVRPGAVYGPGKDVITARVGIDSFGIFMHIGGNNMLPLTYVDNCADAIVTAGLVEGVDAEVFNIVDDKLPSSSQFFKLYKKHYPMKSVRVPYLVFLWFSYFWEKYADLTKGQLPAAFNRYKCAAYWKGNRFSNRKLKRALNWKPVVETEEAYRRYFEYLESLGG